MPMMTGASINWARTLGKPEKELKIFAKRAFNYKNVFDKTTNLMRGRLQNGQFETPFNPLKWGDAFTEGNSWHYSLERFSMTLKGSSGLMGGKLTFNAMLDSVFNLPPAFR
jgi:putative alpha-1,2-mannosidase